MIIIAFTSHTSKIPPRIFCRHFRHCAVIVPNGAGVRSMTMHQFVRRRNVAQISLAPRDIRILGAHGWRFIYLACDIANDFNPSHARTCVDLSKRAIGIHAPLIQTPDALYKYLKK